MILEFHYLITYSKSTEHVECLLNTHLKHIPCVQVVKVKGHNNILTKFKPGITNHGKLVLPSGQSDLSKNCGA